MGDLPSGGAYADIDGLRMYYEVHGSGDPLVLLHGALSAITAAVVGVILNLAIWFAVHTIFRQTRPFGGYGLSFDMPVLASVDPWALALALAAIVAMFRFRVGMLPTLAGCSAAGVALYLGGFAP